MDCIEWKGARVNGYGVKRVDGKLRKAHRLAYCESNGLNLEDIDGKVVRHACDNPGCVNPVHLSLGNQGENMDDKVRRGRAKGQPGGEAHAQAKLTWVIVDEIRQSNLSKKALAEKFGCSRATISLILNNKTWVR